MNKPELVDHIATEAELTKVAAAKALDAVLDGIEKTLKKGEEVRLVGFGTFSVRERAAGKGRNPATGKEIKIAASKNARFKPGAALRRRSTRSRARSRSKRRRRPGPDECGAPGLFTPQSLAAPAAPPGATDSSDACSPRRTRKRRRFFGSAGYVLAWRPDL